MASWVILAVAGFSLVLATNRIVRFEIIRNKLLFASCSLRGKDHCSHMPTSSHIHAGECWLIVIWVADWSLPLTSRLSPPPSKRHLLINKLGQFKVQQVLPTENLTSIWIRKQALGRILFYSKVFSERCIVVPLTFQVDVNFPFADEYILTDKIGLEVQLNYARAQHHVLIITSACHFEA